MNKLHVSARMKILDDKLEGFKQKVFEIISQMKEKDSGTLQYDWFLSSDYETAIINSCNICAHNQNASNNAELFVRSESFICM